MRKIYLLTAIVLCSCCHLHAQWYKGMAQLPSSFDSLVSQPGITLSRLFDSINNHLNMADTGEGGSLEYIRLNEQFWRTRVGANDSDGHSIFDQQY